jgi:predicted dehydrogenase
MVRTGIIGISGFGATHYRDLVREVRHGRMQAVAATVINADEEQEKCAVLQSLGCRLYPDYREMLAAHRGEMDLCLVPTGIHLHTPMTVAALRAGVNVFVEKPAAGSMQDVRAMQTAAQEAGRFVAVGFQRMYDPFTLALKSAILTGEIGRLQCLKVWGRWPRLDSYYARNPWAGRLRKGEAWVLDSPFHNALSHYLMLICFLAGTAPRECTKVETIEAELYRGHAIESTDTACIRIRTREGPLLYFFATHCSAEEDDVGPELMIRGDRGCIAWTQSGGVERAIITNHHGQSRELLSMDHEDAIRSLIMGRLEARVAGADPFLCTLDLAAIQVLCANGAHESSPIHTIDGKHVRKFAVRDSVQTVIAGVDEAVMEGYEREALFSEMDVPWARKGKIVSLGSFDTFDGRRVA